MNEERRDELKDGTPSEIAEVLHGDKANPEVFEQPDAVELPAETLVATEQAPVTRETSK